jgi:hypothetical protein
MTRRRVQSHAQSEVVVGWVEVWSTTPTEGFSVEGTVPLKLPRITARFEDGHYRLHERKALVLPEETAA